MRKLTKKREKTRKKKVINKFSLQVEFHNVLQGLVVNLISE